MSRFIPPLLGHLPGMTEQPATSERLDGVQEHINQARAAAEELHETDALGDTDDDRHDAADGGREERDERADDDVRPPSYAENQEETEAPGPNPL